MKTLELNLGGIRPLQANSQEYVSGWYVDPDTGIPVYYDGVSRNFYTLSGGIYIPLGYMNTCSQAGFTGTGRKAQGQHFLQVFRTGSEWGGGKILRGSLRSFWF